MTRKSAPHRSRDSISSDRIPRVSNHLLASLGEADLAAIAADLDPITLAIKHFVHRPGDLIDYVYFPESGFCSELTVLENGDMVEVATIGREGMVGVFAMQDGQIAPSAAMVQFEMSCFRMPARIYRREMQRGGELRAVMSRYGHAHTALIMQFTACNAVHTVEQRLARWLLMAHDRIGRDEFPLTQEFLAMMLGVARPTVTIVAGTLQKAGLITYRRGSLAVLDREKLEAASCECYRFGTDLLRNVTAPPRTRAKPSRA